jgi:hypothetical protein
MTLAGTKGRQHGEEKYPSPLSFISLLINETTVDNRMINEHGTDGETKRLYNIQK